MSDYIEQIENVDRQVSIRTVEGVDSRVLTLSQSYAAARDEVWSAITSAERITSWLMPVSGDLRLGGRYQLEGNAGGEVLRCSAVESYAVTWEYGGKMSWVMASLSDGDGASTRLDIEHAAPADDESWPEFGAGATGIGWDMMLLGLALHLQGGEGMSPDEGAAWAGSADGRVFMTRSSELWRDASIASGENEADAAAAAARCLAAYTGTEADR